MCPASPVDDVIRVVLRPCGQGDRILREAATSEAQGKLSAIGELVFDPGGMWRSRAYLAAPWELICSSIARRRVHQRFPAAGQRPESGRPLNLAGPRYAGTDNGPGTGRKLDTNDA